MPTDDRIQFIFLGKFSEIPTKTIEGRRFTFTTSW